MTIIGRKDGYADEQLPIEQFETGDTVLAHHPDGSGYTFVVETKQIRINKAEGTSLVGLQAAPNTAATPGGPVATIRAPMGTLAHRVIPDHGTE